MFSSEVKRVAYRLVSGIADNLTGRFGVDMTLQGAFFVGDTAVDYTTTCGLLMCRTNFSAFVNDSFSDPLDIGFEIPMPTLSTPIMGSGYSPSLIRSPKPYNFLPFNFFITYPNPGYN